MPNAKYENSEARNCGRPGVPVGAIGGMAYGEYAGIRALAAGNSDRR